LRRIDAHPGIGRAKAEKRSNRKAIYANHIRAQLRRIEEQRLFGEVRSPTRLSGETAPAAPGGLVLYLNNFVLMHLYATFAVTRDKC
jgi:hypothetical protein